MSSNPPFQLSTNQVAFAENDTSTKTVLLTNRTGRNISFQIAVSQPWITVRFGAQQGNDIPIELEIDSGKMYGGGPHAASLTIEAGGTRVEVQVTVDAKGSSSSGGSGSGGSGSGGGGSGTTAAVRPSWSMPFSLSLPIAVMFLSLLGSIVFTVTKTILVQSAEEAGSIVTYGVTAGILALYLLIALRRVVVPSGTVLAQGSTVAEHQRFMEALAWVCGKAGVRTPRVLLDGDPAPNLRSHGIAMGFSCLCVNDGLLKRVPPPKTKGDPDALRAVIAHEIAHLRRFDTLLFTSLGPMLTVARLALGVAAFLCFGLYRAVRGGGIPKPSMSGLLSELFRKMFTPQGAIMVFIVMFAAILLLGFVVSVLLTIAIYAMLAVGGMIVIYLGYLAYARHSETSADLGAARLLDDSDLVVGALGYTGDYWPDEKATLDQFRATFAGGSKDPAEIIRALKSGADPRGMLDSRKRLWRSHPYMIERLASLIRECGTKIT